MDIGLSSSRLESALMKGNGKITRKIDLRYPQDRSMFKLQGRLLHQLHTIILIVSQQNHYDTYNFKTYSNPAVGPHAIDYSSDITDVTRRFEIA